MRNTIMYAPLRHLTLAGAFALTALATPGLAHAEGAAELTNASGIQQSLRAGATLYVDILGYAEGISWTGDGNLEVYAEDGTLITTLASGQSTGAIGVLQTVRLVVLSKQSTSAAWDISVSNPSISGGRLYGYNWIFDLGSFAATHSTYASFYARVPGGTPGTDAVIELKLDGLSGYIYDLSANRVGVDGPDAGRSVSEATGSVTPEYPLYLNPPADAVYASVTPTIAGFGYEGSSNPAVSDGGELTECDSLLPGVQTGHFVFTTNVEGTYNLICDVDGDSEYERNGDDLLLIGATAPGENQIPWDGSLTGGATAAAGDYACSLQINVGEFHYVARDIETSYQGMRIFEYDPVNGRTPLNMFWDDSERQSTAVLMPNGQVGLEFSPAGGMDPGPYADPAVANTNARAWGEFAGSGKGNQSLLDTYAYARSSTNTIITVGVADGTTDSDADGATDYEEECVLGTDPADPEDGGQYPTGAFVRRSTVLFEDMIGAGQNDWDYNDFVVQVDVAGNTDLARTGIEEITLTYTPLARGAGYYHDLYQRIPFTGGWSATLTVGGVEVDSWSGSGDLDVKLDETLDLLPAQVGSFTNTDGGQASWADGVEVVLSVSVDTPASNPTSMLTAHPFDLYLDVPYAPAANTEIHLATYSGQTETIGSDFSNIPVDLQGTPLPFALVVDTSETVYWPCEGRPAWHTLPHFNDWARGGVAAPTVATVFTTPTSPTDVWSASARATTCP
jgi:LruC domain-containing protein